MPWCKQGLKLNVSFSQTDPLKCFEQTHEGHTHTHTQILKNLLPCSSHSIAKINEGAVQYIIQDIKKNVIEYYQTVKHF